MDEVRVRAEITGWHSDDPPGWIEVRIVDWLGEDHTLVDKVPVLTVLDITPTSPFPVEVWIAAEAQEVGTDDVVVTLAEGVETVDGESVLTMAADDVVWL